MYTVTVYPSLFTPEQVGQSGGYCTDGDASSYMERGHQTLHQRKVKVAAALSICDGRRGGGEGHGDRACALSARTVRAQRCP
jgi:hypothetical protein